MKRGIIMKNQEGNRSFQFFDNLMKTRESSLKEIKANVSSAINHSGNSDVDVSVNVQMDTMPIALSLLSLSLANKQISREEFEQAVEELIRINNQYKNSNSKMKGDSKVALFTNEKNKKIWGRE